MAINVNNGNGALAAYSYADNAQKTSAGETGSTQEVSETEKLEAFKKEIWKEINSLSWGASVSIQITDKAFEKMMHDSEFKDKMMNVIREDARGSYTMCGGTFIEIGENGYHGYSYMAYHAKEANAAYESHSKGSFYSKKVKNQKVDDIWEEKLAERERQQELRDKKYFRQKRLAEYWNKRQSAAASYDASVLAEPVENGG